MWTQGECGDVIINNDHPLVIGHEAGGVVMATGEGVQNLKVGSYGKYYVLFGSYT